MKYTDTKIQWINIIIIVYCYGFKVCDAFSIGPEIIWDTKKKEEINV